MIVKHEFLCGCIVSLHVYLGTKPGDDCASICVDKESESNHVEYCFIHSEDECPDLQGADN